MGELLVRDHDYLETAGQWFFCVVGDVHPPDGFFAYLKYIPGPGPWRRGGRSFSRSLKSYSMSELKENLETLKKLRPRYIRRDPMIGAEMSYVPADEIVRHYGCREAVKRLMDKDERDEVEENAVRFIDELSHESKISLEYFGLTGSLLLGIHHPGSDIDLIVYGRKNFWKVLETVETLGYSGWSNGVNHITGRYPISRREAEKLASRVKHKGTYRGKPFSIHGVKEKDEIEEQYGDRVYKMVGLARARLEVIDEQDSGFTPAIYLVEGEAETREGSSYPVERLTCYDLSYLAILKPGDRIEVYGKLEEVNDRRKERIFYSLLIGSIEAAGKEYVKLI